MLTNERLEADLKEAREEIKALHHECAGLKEGRCFPCEETDKVNNEFRNITIPKLKARIAKLEKLAYSDEDMHFSYKELYDKLRAEITTLKSKLTQALAHIEEHNREYHHVTPSDQIEQMKKATDDNQHYAIIGMHTGEQIGCTWGEEGKEAVLAEEPDARFVLLPEEVCKVCKEK